MPARPPFLRRWHQADSRATRPEYGIRLCIRHRSQQACRLVRYETAARGPDGELSLSPDRSGELPPPTERWLGWRWVGALPSIVGAQAPTPSAPSGRRWPVVVEDVLELCAVAEAPELGAVAAVLARGHVGDVGLPAAWIGTFCESCAVPAPDGGRVFVAVI